MSKSETLFNTFKAKGFRSLLKRISKPFFPVVTKPIENFQLYKKYFKLMKGIEIGGASPIFSKEIPIYQIVNSLDGCNFSISTVWEGSITEGNNYNYFKNKTGFQFVCEASDLKQIPSNKYDFLISSHCLEHCANTLKTVAEWTRVVKKGGAILLILPDRQFTFDHKRPVTSFDHLIDDYNTDVTETDLTHLNEILDLHDLTMDPDAGDIEAFKIRSLANYENRCLHHHIFDFDLLKEIYARHNIDVIDTTFARPYHQIILGIKQ